ncbi:MAG: universal stress protein [Betaproteobacteria bacterium]|jgi:nucleotide-binding universal stress UspA family protein|nr:universal stress protein [Betaproteobacteria bacterium]NBT10832.1 universal stress protein [Betaproteobacteria bacterium]NBU49833.1 universal stress protein [Betaproteobacteria bacterium]
MKILLAVDGSPYTKRMLAYVAAHDEWLGAHHAYTVVTVLPAVTPRAAAVLDKAVLKAYYEEEAEKIIKPVRAFFKRQVQAPVEFEVKVGHAAQQIAAATQNTKPDLLIMGSHGHGNLGNLVMGSVATQVMARTTVPVLLVR